MKQTKVGANLSTNWILLILSSYYDFSDATMVCFGRSFSEFAVFSDTY
jgi:hypothetical protein